MAPTAVAKVFADLDKHERVLRRALGWSPSDELLDVQRKIADSTTFDLLASDAATMLSGVSEHPAVALFEQSVKLMDQPAVGFTDPFEERGVGRALRERDELEQRLIRAGCSGTLMHELENRASRLTAPGDGADFLGAPRRTRDLNGDIPLLHDIGHVPSAEVLSEPASLYTSPPGVATPFVDLPPTIVPKRRRAQPLGSLIVPADLAEADAADEARSNQIAVEEFLRENTLDDALEDLKVIAVRLVSGTRSDRLHAAMSASHLFEGVANFVFPGQGEKYVDRFGNKRSVENQHVRNRISAFVDLHLREEISTHDAKRLQAKIDNAHTWSAEGHHVAYPPQLASRAYRDTLEVLAYVAHAWERSMQLRRTI